MYQHDIRPDILARYLRDTVTECVACVGLDLNSAGVQLLEFVPGLNRELASSIVEYRKRLPTGYQNRKQVGDVPGMTLSAWTHAMDSTNLWFKLDSPGQY